jgi:penicillin-binding protein 2
MRRTGRLSTPRPTRLRRSFGARVFLAFCMLVLTGAAAKLQVLNDDEYVEIARKNRLREVMVPAPRGTIYDRHGQVIAENRVGYRVLLMPDKPDSMNVQLKRLQLVLGMTDEEIARARKRHQREVHLPMTVLDNAPEDAVARLEEQRLLFPTVLVHEYAKRYYPTRTSIAHMIGYVAEISDAELKTPQYAGYLQGRWIGKGGLEKQYERWLGGEPGSRYLQIDAMGRIIDWLPDTLGAPPIPGRDLQLHLDLDLQRYIEGIWPRQYRGGFVAIEPSTGGILAYYSYPSFDPNAFIGGIPDTLWKRLNDDPAKPMLDRAGGTGAAQPPASTWKLMVAAMALEEGVITAEEKMPVACTGGIYMLGRYALCWEKGGHGKSDLIKGIMQSCDVYFYQVGMRLGLKRFTATGSRMGFAKRTGIDLPNEPRNSFPDSPEWWLKNPMFRYKPKESEVMSMAIGQGPISMTPLKMATLYAALARPDGKEPTPRIAMMANDSTRTTAIDMGLNRKHVSDLWRGMRRVVAPGGTSGLTRLKDWDFMGKTGTAQACARCSIKDHAWFIGMAGPIGKDPEIVAAMFLQNAEHGWSASDYVANGINFYLNRKYNRPFERYPTPRLRYGRNLPVDQAWLWSPVVDPVRPGDPVPTPPTNRNGANKTNPRQAKPGQ